MTNSEITKKLHEYYDAQKRIADIKIELIRIAVEHGQNQHYAKNGNAAIEYLDGYLSGTGSLPAARRPA